MAANHRLSPALLAALVDGLDWSRVHVPRIVPSKATDDCDELN
jgi:hypothetical protein